MRLKKDIDMNAFLEAAKKCHGAVFFQTTEGDILNLKSLLSRYVLMSIMGKPHLLESAQITCVQEDDYQKLTEFLEEAE
ncbi:MAG: hypothetical protein J1E03_12325 [Acetatifactor sp.]|nr:hypothetical protein [Acetatifactor sp.]